MSFMLLGILNSQAAGGGAGAFDLLETTTLTSSASSVTFSGLGAYSDYKHLQIRGEFSQSGGDVIFMRFNGVSTTSYAWHNLSGGRFSTAESEAGSSVSYMRLGVSPGSARTGLVCDLLDYSSNVKNTTGRWLFGQTDGPRIVLGSGGFFNTAAVSSLSLHASSGYSFQSLSRFSLYGVK